MKTYLFSGYARLPQDVSHQALYRRLGIVVEVDESGVIERASSSLTIEVAQDFLSELLVGKSVISDGEAVEALIRQRYRGHSQGALMSAMRRIYESASLSDITWAPTKSQTPK